MMPAPPRNLLARAGAAAVAGAIVLSAAAAVAPVSGATCGEDLDHCYSCATANGRDCVECERGYEVRNNRCEKMKYQCGISNCYACDTATRRCTGARSGYRVTPAGGVQKCLVDDCSECKDDASECTRCEANKELVDGQCVDAACGMRGCEECKYGRCDDAADGYYLVGDGTVAACKVEHCHECKRPGDECKKCDKGYRLSSDKRTCTLDGSKCAVDDCDQCVAGKPFQCQRAKRGHRVTGAGLVEECMVDDCDKCDADATVCEVCESGRTLSEDRAICARRECGILGCEKCNGRRCTKADDGYYLMGDGTVTRCSDPNCDDCRRGLTRCAKCRDGYSMDGSGFCAGYSCNITGCAYCAAATEECTRAASGFHLLANNVPTRCAVEHCLDCSSDPAVCTACENAYKPDGAASCVLDPSAGTGGGNGSGNNGAATVARGAAAAAAAVLAATVALAI